MLCSNCFLIAFQPWTKEINQIRNNILCVVARHIFVFRCTLTTNRCNAFQHIFRNQKKSELYDPDFQTMLFLVIMVYIENFSRLLVTSIVIAIWGSLLIYCRLSVASASFSTQPELVFVFLQFEGSNKNALEHINTKANEGIIVSEKVSEKS